jgi:FixJ family two-component response regulator
MTDETSIVFIVDDDTSIREALEDLFTSVGLRTIAFTSPREFLVFERPDVASCLVLDVRLPGSSGLEFHRELIAADCKIPVIFITGHGDIPMSVRAMKAGAIEFLTKPFRDQDMLDAVQHAIDSDLQRRKSEKTISDLTGRLATLTARERQVLEILVTGQLNKQIGATIGTTESTVKAHRTQIMRKMQAGSLAELVRMTDRLNIRHASN